MSKKISERGYCRLNDYIQDHHPVFHEILNNTCTLGYLVTGKMRPAVTVIIPTNDKFLNTLRDDSLSIDSDKVNNVASIVSALILRGKFKTSTDWKSGNVPNSMIPSKNIPIKSATDSKVVLDIAGGIEIVSPPKGRDFHDVSKFNNLAVWFLEGAKELSISDFENLENAKITRPARREKGTSREKTGGYSANINDFKFRDKLALTVENEFMYIQKAGLNNSEPSPYCKHVLSLLCFLKHNDYEDLYYTVLPLWSGVDIDFYIIFEPHIKNDYLISNDILEKWYNTCKSKVSDYKSIRDTIIKDLDSNHEGAHVFSSESRKNIHEGLHQLITDPNGLLECKNKRLTDGVRSIYDDIINHNKIGDVSDVFPQTLIAHYKANPFLKIAQDELRFITCEMFEELYKNFDIALYNELVNVIGEYMHQYDANKSTNKLVNGEILKFLISPDEIIAEICTFINSTCFAYIPLLESELKDIKHVNEHPRDKIKFLNVNSRSYERHDRIFNSLSNSGNNDDILRILESINPSVYNEVKSRLSSM
jgi:hypothetical protein